MLYRRPTKTSPGIDLSPLIDVVFLLLIFFMVSTTFNDSHGMDLDLPHADAESKAEPQAVRIQLSRDGDLRLAGTPMLESELEAAVRERLRDSEDKMVVLEVDGQVEHAQVVSIMDRLRKAGATGISFATNASGRAVKSGGGDQGSEKEP